jgi:hypothetical protein
MRQIEDLPERSARRTFGCTSSDRSPISSRNNVPWFAISNGRSCGTCTTAAGLKGRCGNTYIREEELSGLFEEVVRRIQLPGEIADAIAETLRTSQADTELSPRTLDFAREFSPFKVARGDDDQRV